MLCDSVTEIGVWHKASKMLGCSTCILKKSWHFIVQVEF